MPQLSEARRAHKAAYYQNHKAEAAAHREQKKDEKRAYDAVYKAFHREDAREKDARRRVWFLGNLNILRAAQGCDDCGTHEGMLHHHHVDPSTKLYNVSQMQTCSLERFLDEIVKCAVLCVPCHSKYRGL